MEDSADLTAALDQVRDRCACAHAVAFTIALADIVSEIGHSNDHVPALRGLLALCDEFPVPHRRVLPVHVKSARAMLLEILSALLPEWLRPFAPGLDTLLGVTAGMAPGATRKNYPGNAQFEPSRWSAP